LVLKSWDDLRSVFAQASEAIIPTHTNTPKNGNCEPGKHLLAIIMDFNAPNSRDSMTLQKLCKSVSTVASSHGVQNTVVFAIMATRAKEDCEDDPFEDEHRFSGEMKKSGFGYQQRVRMQLNPPNEDTVSACHWDFWQDARLMYPFPNEKEAQSRSQWYAFSELARTTRIEGSLPTINNCDLAHIVDDDHLGIKTANPNMRAAQRGLDANLAILQQLLNKSKTRPTNEVWLQSKDLVDILELHPHNGDRTLAVIKMITQGTFPNCKLRTMLASQQYKKSQNFVKFTQAFVTRTVIVQC
jgi:hypothetical protein